MRIAGDRVGGRAVTAATGPTGLRRLTGFGPHNGAHRVATRASVSILVPMLVLVAIGHAPWAIYAAFGAFTSLYGRERVDVQRLLLQTEAGALLVLCVCLGAVVGVSPHRAWLAVPAAAVVAVVATYVSVRRRWHPPGPLFAVFGLASVASVPGTWHGVGVAATVAGLTALFSLLVGNIGAMVRRVRRTAEVPVTGPSIGGVVAPVWRQAIASGVGVLVAGSIATAGGIGRPYWAMVSAVVPLVARHLGDQVVRGVHRVVGTAGGLVIAWLLLELDLPALATILLVAVLQAGAELLVGRNYALALLSITPLALLMVHMAAPIPPGRLVADRGIETLIGVAIGLAVGWLARPRVARASAAQPASMT